METCKLYYCYRATNQVNGKVYIGFAADPQTRWRNHKRDAEKCKGYAFAAAIRKHGWENFQFEIVCCGKDKREMLEYVEPLLIEQYQSSIDKNGYNILQRPMMALCGPKNGGKKGHIVTPETRAKISAARKGRQVSEETKRKLRQRTWKMSPETKQRMSAAHQGHIVTEATRIKISTGNKGRQLTEEQKEKLRKLRIGCIDSKETRQKKSAALKGRIVTPQTRMKIGAANKGHIVTEETRMKIGAANKKH